MVLDLRLSYVASAACESGTSFCFVKYFKNNIMEQPITNAIINYYSPYSVKCDILNFYKTLQSTNNVIIKQCVDDIILIPLNDKGKQEINEIKEKVKEIIKRNLNKI